VAASGVLSLNKPTGLTSRQVVDRVQRLARPAKVGHAGTLDPLAGGVLVVCVGAATRLIEHVQQMPKGYTGTFLLGRQSPSEDIEGEVTELDHPPVPTLEQITAAAGALVGLIEQRPPVYSALKVGGRRAYALARKGQPVELKPRTVTVYRIEVLAYAYPELRLAIECGGGTYVRSLGRDLAESLGTSAVMSGLLRTSIGEFRIEEAVDPGQLTSQNWTDYLLPPLAAVGRLPRVELSAEEVAKIRNGCAIPVKGQKGGTTSQPTGARRVLPTGTGPFAGVDAAGRLVAVLTPRGRGLLGPLRNLTTKP
jgi:tRNA pseudouridine55 synthase